MKKRVLLLFLYVTSYNEKSFLPTLHEDLEYGIIIPEDCTQNGFDYVDNKIYEFLENNSRTDYVKENSKLAYEYSSTDETKYKLLNSEEIVLYTFYARTPYIYGTQIEFNIIGATIDQSDIDKYYNDPSHLFYTSKFKYEEDHGIVS